MLVATTRPSRWPVLYAGLRLYGLNPFKLDRERAGKYDHEVKILKDRKGRGPVLDGSGWDIHNARPEAR